MKSDITTLFRSATAHSRALDTKEYSAVELTRALLELADRESDIGAFLKLDADRALGQARASDERRARGQSLGPLDGIPVAIKDNIVERGEHCTCGSKILQNFVSPYDAAVIEKLRGAGAVLFGRTNMDEFAMGSSTENSALGLTRNPWNRACVPGGSSGGSAAAVAAGFAPLALGSDTGGSIRQPAAFCGVVGLKPTYGRVSRYGLVAYASSLDQIGPFARSVEDAALLLAAIAGVDARDSTSHPDGDKHPVAWHAPEFSDRDWKNLRVGVMLPENNAGGFDADVLAAARKAVAELEQRGARIVPLQSQLEQFLIPIYYILATAEASSNLSRYDGVRYGHRAPDAENLMELYVRSRTQGFGPEVKRRILLGAFALSSGYFDAYYKKAQKARRKIQNEYTQFFTQCDVILQPTSPNTAFAFGAKTADPLAMYQSDILTIAANLAGIPAISVPAGLDSDGLPIGLQLLAAPFQENRLLRAAHAVANFPGFAPDYSAIYAGKPGRAASPPPSVASASVAARPGVNAKPEKKSAPAAPKTAKPEAVDRIGVKQAKAAPAPVHTPVKKPALKVLPKPAPAKSSAKKKTSSRAPAKSPAKAPAKAAKTPVKSAKPAARKTAAKPKPKAAAKKAPAKSASRASKGAGKRGRK